MIVFGCLHAVCVLSRNAWSKFFSGVILLSSSDQARIYLAHWVHKSLKSILWGKIKSSCTSWKTFYFDIERGILIHFESYLLNNIGKTIVFLKEEWEKLYLLFIFFERAAYRYEREVTEFTILAGKQAIMKRSLV